MGDDSEGPVSAADEPDRSPPDEIMDTIHDGTIVMLSDPSENKRQLISSALWADVSICTSRPGTLMLNAIRAGRAAATEAEPTGESSDSLGQTEVTGIEEVEHDE